MEMFKYDSKQMVQLIQKLNTLKIHFTDEIKDLLLVSELCSIKTKHGMMIFYDKFGYLKFSSEGVIILSMGVGVRSFSHPIANYVNQVFDRISEFVEVLNEILEREKNNKIESEVSKFVGITV